MSHSALFVTTVPITLGAFLVPFAAHFRAQGWRVDALSNGATQYAPIYATFDNRYDITWSRNPLNPNDLFDTWARVRRVVIEGGYDVVHVHTPIAAFMTRYALRSLPEKERPVVIYTAHGFHFFKGQGLLGHAAFRTMERIAAPWTDYLVTINRQDFEAARRFRGIPAERVRYIPGIGVDVDRFAEGVISAQEAASVRRKLDISDDAFMLTMIAEFAPVKRHDLVIDALSRVAAERVVLALVGQGALEAEIRDKAARLGVVDRVRFAGFRRDIPAVLAASDALTLVSQREGLARSALEAMAAGKPVIGTDTRGISDAVATAGWIVPGNDPVALAEAIDAAAGNRDEARRRGEIGRKRARREFSLNRIIDAYEGLYLEAIESRRRP
ncbi:MAG: glycosyltransferase family 1 protein [Actinobacteria bacterium HGW-Actinobacteria-10]|jgi:glycosyltransferase involved in cell wall biosynthesis|nr:MAG: glycosyltransferase family 1 protein [Actinobacteria bacterium HGW-Actinobacteria-10]